MAKKNKISSSVKNSLEQRRLEEIKKKEEAKRKKLRLLPLLSLLIAGVLLLMMLVNWAAVYNTNSGIEVKVSGFQCVRAGISGNYTSADAAYGDIAVPFNYYAAGETHSLCTVSVIVLFVIVAHLVVLLFATITNKQGVFNLLGIVFSLAEFSLFIACYAVALSMKDASILSTYCNGNPACSIVSTAIVPALVAFFSVAVPVLALILSKKSAPKGEKDAVSESNRKG